MKKTILFIAAVIFVFCIFSIATAQAMTRQSQGESLFASNAVLHVLNQKEPHNMDMGPNNPLPQDNVLTYDPQKLRGTIIARVSTRPVRPGNRNPYVKRRGYDSSDYDNESARDAGEDDEIPENNSAVEYNEDLENSSGYNEDL